MTFSGRFLLNIIHFATQQGADYTALVKLSEESVDDLCREDYRVGAEVYNRVVEAAVEQTEDPWFGLHIGEYLNLSAAGLIAQITMSSRNVKEALDYCCEFASLGCRALVMNFEEEKECYRLTFTPDPLWLQQSEEAVRHTIDGTIVFTIREFHALTRQKHFPISVALPYQPPWDPKEYNRILRCPVKFGQDQTEILFEKAHIEAPVITSDYNLLRILVEHAREKEESLKREQGFLSVVRKSIINMVRPEFPTINEVASNLNLSVRTMQRKLKEEGVTYKDLMEGLRKEFALSYLKRADLSISEVAYLLSYADASTFIRSFKRWTGQTPKSFRETAE